MKQNIATLMRWEMSGLVWETSTVLVMYRFCAELLRIYGWFNQIYRTSLLFLDQQMFMLLPRFLPCHFWSYSSQSQKKWVNFIFYRPLGPLSKLEPTTDVDHNLFFKPKWHFDWLIEQKRSHNVINISNLKFESEQIPQSRTRKYISHCSNCYNPH